MEKVISLFLLISIVTPDDSLKKLNEFLMKNKGIEAYCSVKKNGPLWCSSFLELGIDRPPKERRVRDWRGIALKKNILNSYQGRAYPDLLRAMRFVPAKQLLPLVDTIVESSGCPRNFSAASLRRIETLLPSTEAQAAMNKLYEHAAACMQPSDDGYEMLHLRQALLRELWGNREGARSSIQRALLVTKSAEYSRLQFWAGLLSEKSEIRNQIWTQLIRQKPLSFHALLAAKALGIDPKRDIDSRADFIKTDDSKTHKALLEVMEWFKALVDKKYNQGAVRLAKEIVNHQGDQLQGSQMLELTEVISQNLTHLDTIDFLNQSIDGNPHWLNAQLLKMLYPNPYFELISKKSLNLDTFLVVGLIRQESGFNPLARSRANARGLMQVLPSTARRVDPKGARNLFDIESNSSVGTKYLQELIGRFGDTELALAAYNAGEKRVEEWLVRYPAQDKLLFIDLIPFRETRNYVSSILRNNYWYHRIYETDSKKIFAASESNSDFKKSNFIRDLFKPSKPRGFFQE